MATQSSILAWRIPWIEEPSGLQSMGCKEWDKTVQPTFTFKTSVMSKENIITPQQGGQGPLEDPAGKKEEAE